DGGDAVHLRHPQVHQHHVGPLLAGEGDRHAAVGCLADHGDVVAGLQQHPEPGSQQGLVVGEQHPDHSAAPATGRLARTSKPPPDLGPAVSLPPTAAARSAMPVRPWPPLPDWPLPDWPLPDWLMPGGPLPGGSLPGWPAAGSITGPSSVTWIASAPGW